jgi:hypothetical protein
MLLAFLLEKFSKHKRPPAAASFGSRRLARSGPVTTPFKALAQGGQNNQTGKPSLTASFGWVATGEKVHVDYQLEMRTSKARSDLRARPCMHTSIHRYHMSAAPIDDPAEVGWRLGALLARSHGFAAAVVLEDTTGALFTIRLFEDQASLIGATSLA